LTKKDKTDLKFVAQSANTVNFSFVNNKQDVEELLNELKKLKANIGIILKIETKEAYRNLPGILLKGMENYPIGVMIARGDLAIETGWKNFAIIQEEILQLCEAAHLPDIWATQVLENLAKKGIPTRAEITDAAMAQRADCVMLNKGPYIEKTVRMLDKVLRKMQRIQNRKITILPKLEFNENL
jgi:pyruvate kinase